MFQQPSVSEAIVGWPSGRACFTHELSRAAAATLSGSPICQWLKQDSFAIHICNGWCWAPGQITVRTDACPGQCPPLGQQHIQRNASRRQAALQWHIRVPSDFSTEVNWNLPQPAGSQGTHWRAPGLRLPTPAAELTWKTGWQTCLPATTLVRSLSFYLYGMGGPAGSLSSHQHSSRGHRGTQAPLLWQGSGDECTIKAEVLCVFAQLVSLTICNKFTDWIHFTLMVYILKSFSL